MAAFEGMRLLVASIKNMTDEVRKEYINNQKIPKPDNDFVVILSKLQSAEWSVNPALAVTRGRRLLLVKYSQLPTRN